MKVSSKLLSITNHHEYLDLVTDGAKFRIYLLDENIIRIRGTFDDDFAPEESYALVKTAWADATDDLIGDERQRVTPIAVELTETADGYTVSNGRYTLEIHAEPFYFEIKDQNGVTVHKDLVKRSFV